MLSLLITGCSAESKWKLAQTIKLSEDKYNIFGRAVAISTTEPKRLVISASWEGYDDIEGTVNERTGAARGAAYFYEYSSEKNEYVLKQKIEPTDNDEVEVKNFGSTIRISADGKRIVAGAPYSTVKNSDGESFKEAGAVVVFDMNSSYLFEQKAILHVDPIADTDAGQGLGRSLTTTPDCKIISSAYYNKPNMVDFIHDQGSVFVAEEKDGQFSNFAVEAKIDPKDIYADYSEGDFFKFGSSLAFVDASHLLVASYLFTNANVDGAVPDVKYGTAFIKKDGSNWIKDSIIPVPAVPEGKSYSEYGSPVSMPNNNQNVMATYGGYNDDSTQFFINEKSGNEWKSAQIIQAESSTGAVFCDDSVFFTDAGNEYNENKTMYKSKIGIYRRNTEGKYVLTETIESELIPTTENFGSDMQWGDECKSIYVGSMAKVKEGKTHIPKLGSKAYIYRLIEETQSNSEDDHLVVTIVCSIVGVIVVIGIIIGVVFYVRKNKRESIEEEEEKQATEI